MDSDGKKMYLANKVLKAHNLEINNRTINISYNKNQKGEFVKLQENSLKSKITISSVVLSEITSKLSELQECDKTLEEYNPKKFEEVMKNNKDNERNEVIHKSVNLRSQQKRYYLDLKDTKYGRVVRISQVKDNNRSNITLNVEAITHLINVLNSYLSRDFVEPTDDKVDETSEKSKIPHDENSNKGGDGKRRQRLRNKETTPNSDEQSSENKNQVGGYSDSRSLTYGKKKYFFECKSTNSGIILKLSQNGRANKPFVVFGSESLNDLRKTLDEMIEKANGYYKESSAPTAC